MSSTDWKAKALELEWMMDEQRRRTGEALRVLQSSLDDVRLKIKVMAHDLESTRRERDALIRHIAGLDGDC